MEEVAPEETEPMKLAELIWLVPVLEWRRRNKYSRGGRGKRFL